MDAQAQNEQVPVSLQTPVETLKAVSLAVVVVALVEKDQQMDAT